MINSADIQGQIWFGSCYDLGHRLTVFIYQIILDQVLAWIVLSGSTVGSLVVFRSI
jgi:hypothetical protein